MKSSVRLLARVALLVVGACTAGAGDDFASGGGVQTGGPNGTGNGSFASGTSTGFGQGGGPPGLTYTCSADLQHLVAEDGTVQTCPPDQGCAAGKCVPACDAAAASQGSIGCDFFAPDPPFLSNGQGSTLDGPCYAVFVANTWSRSAKLSIDRGGTPVDVTSFARIPKTQNGATTYESLPVDGVPPNEVAILFLSHKPGVVNFTSLECPVPPAILEDAAVSGSGRGAAFHVQSDTPVSAYDMLPFGGATSYLPSATLLYPSTAWGTNYIAVPPHPEASGALWMLLVGQQDGTTVTIAPPTTLPGGGTAPTLPGGQQTTVPINRGEIVQWIGVDPSGTIIQSDKPVGMWTGSTYLAVHTSTLGSGGQDSSHQQIPHIKALGSEYAAAGVVTRLQGNAPESVLYRIAGAVDGTTLVYDPAPPPGAPQTLGATQIAEFETSIPFTVKSQDDQHPFLLTQYMSGTAFGTRDGCGSTMFGGECGLGDEEWVNLVPPIQFLQRYVFFTDPTYATTNLVIVRKKGPSGFADVELSCMGAVPGFQPLGTSGDYEFAHVDLMRGFAPVANCGTSRHEASSAQPFGVVVWGTDYYASYGYPAGGNVGSVNDVEVPPVVPQ